MMDEFGFMTHESIVSMKDTVEILADIAAEQHRDVVLLGRDMWPIAALCRANGVKVKYFHVSRLQVERTESKPDLVRSTIRQWKADIKPGAIVVDTGFSGTILEFISGYIDLSMVGLLFSSAGLWPEIGSVGVDEVQDFEDFPKPTPRCTGYGPQGNALWDSGSRFDSGEVSMPECIRFVDCLGIPSNTPATTNGVVVGHTREERIGVSDASDVDFSDMYEDVQPMTEDEAVACLFKMCKTSYQFEYLKRIREYARYDARQASRNFINKHDLDIL